MIIITMAGLSSRFFKAGYTLPKYQLELAGETVFAHAVKSFSSYFAKDRFLFIVRDVFNTAEFVNTECVKLGIEDFDVIVLDIETRGQAETAYLATREYTEDFPIYIFNIDTFRYGYIKPDFVDTCDGYLEVFRADGDHWSFVGPGPDQSVVRTTEKERISDLCSDGLYYFKSKRVFEQLYLNAVNMGSTVRGEFYVAPLYNKLIADGGIVKYETIGLDQIGFCGTPDEYQNLLRQHAQQLQSN